MVVMTVVAFGQETPPANPPKQPVVQTDVPVDVPAVTFRGHTTEVTSLSFSEDGSRAVSTSDKEACIWDPATGKELHKLKVDGESVVGFRRDFARYLIARSFHFNVGAARGKMTLRDTTSGQDLWTVDPFGDWNRNVTFLPIIAAVAFSPDGKSVATAGGEVKVRGSLHRGIVKIWSAETGEQLRQFDELASRAGAVAFSSDGKYLAAGTSGTSGEAPESAEVHVWDASTGQRLLALSTRMIVEQGGNPGSVLQLAFHPEGNRLAAAVSDGTVRLWELPSGKELYELRGHQGKTGKSEVDRFTGQILGRSSAVRAVAFHPDGSRLASAGYDRIVRVWNSKTGEQAATYRFDSPRINAVAFSHDGQFLAAAGSNLEKSGEVAIWKSSDNSNNLGGPVPPAVRKDEIANREMKARKQIEDAVKTDEMEWKNLDASQRGIRDRIVKVLHKNATLNDQQVALAVYLLTIGRPPTDAEAKQFEKEVADSQDRPLCVVRHAHTLVQTNEFSAPLADINNRLSKVQTDLEMKRAAGGIPIVMSADEFQKFTEECATALSRTTKVDEQFTNLAFLLTMSRFPSPVEATQFNAHLKRSPDHDVATRDIFVGLMNTREFLQPR